MLLLKQSTTATIKIGPILDSAGAAYTSAAIGDISVAKNGTDAALTSETLTHLHNGVYTLALTTTNTNTLGRIEISCNKTGGYGMAVKEAMILPATVYDALVTNAVGSSGGFAASDNVTAIKAKTDNLPTDPADASDIASSFSTVNSTLTTIAGYIDTEVAAIKAKTDNLPASPAATSDCLTAAGVRSAIGLASANLDTQLDALPTANEVRDAVFAQTVEGSYDFLECNRIYAAVLGGKSTVSTTSAVFRNIGDTKDVVDATLSSSSRTAVTYDVT